MKINSCTLSFGFLFILVSSTFQLLGQDSQKKISLNAEVIPMVYHGQTVALRDYVEDPNAVNEITKTAKPGYHKKKHWILNETVNPNALPMGLDPALQTDYAHPIENRELVSNYAGMGDTGVDPADPSIDVGPNHVIQMINGASGSYFRVWNKTGTSLIAQTYLDNFMGFPGGAGDPIVLYDAPADRWLMSEFTSTGNQLSVAVSTTPDPLGTWNIYSFNAPTFPDYPKYSIWNNAYIVTTNENTSAVYALDRSKMLLGQAATSQRFTLTNFGTIGFQAATPVNLDGTTLPPSGTPAMVMRMRDDAWTGAASDALEMWAFNINWTTPANTTLTQIAVLPVTAFASELCGYTSFSCIPQPGTNVQLDPLREVLMNRIHYRNFGTHESIVCCHVVDVNGSDRAGMRWYELRRTNGTAGTWSIYQQGTYSPDAVNRWMGSIGISASGAIGLAYNVSNGTVYPGLRYTGRKSCDPLGVMTEPETTIIAGSGANSSNRYGDYNALGIDPADGETFWFTGMYNTSGSWSTRIAAFDIPSCNAAVQFGASTATASEANANVDNTCNDYQIVQVPIQVGSAPSANASITVSVVGGTATAGLDYQLQTTSVTLNSSTLTANVNIWVFNDGIVEGNETIVLGYTLNANGGNAQQGTINQTVTITINDNDVDPNTASSNVTILSNTFESGLGTITTVNPSNNTAWQVGTAAQASSNAFTVAASNNTQIAWINDDACNCNQNNVSLLFPVLNLSAYNAATLTFNSYYENNTYQGNTESANLRVSVNGGAFVTVGPLVAADNVWVNQQYDLTPYVGNASVQFSIVYSDGTGWLYGCAVDNILITGDASIGIQTAVNSSTPTTQTIGAIGTTHYYDTTSNNIMLSLANASAVASNCLTVEVDRQGTTPTALAFTSNLAAQFAMSKTYKLTTSAAYNGSYSLTLFYKENEVAAWEAATGNSRNNIEMVRVIGASSFAAVTPANYTGFNIQTQPVVVGSFNGDVTFTASFSGAFGSFGMAIIDAETSEPAPVAAFTASTNAICVGETISFQDTSTGNPSGWSWNFGALGQSSEQNPSFTFNTAGTYSISLTVSNSSGVDTQLESSFITVYPSFTTNESISICDGESITIGNIVYSSDAVITTSLSSQNGCDSTIVTTLNVLDNPIVTFIGPNETLYCDLDLPVVLVGDPAGGVFTGPGMSGNIFNPAIAGVGAHTITYTYTDPNVCSGEATLALQVEICEGVGERGLTDVIIYPNPSNGLFTVSGLEKGQWLRIYDSAGKLVHEQLIGSTFEQVIASNLATGNYVLRSVKDGEEGALRFVILHP
ncbi:MAG: PKD domain-containing protein [Flavobacteriales bacterium]